MITEAIAKIVDRHDLTHDEALGVMNEIMSGETTPVQTAAFLTALRTKGETVTEITACAEGMRAHALKFNHSLDLLEITGTGGTKAKSFNVSTTSSIVVAAGGVKVAKHGDRAATSKSGAADCLEALGVKIDLSPEQCFKLLESTNICFFFAQKYHTAMKYVGNIRRELGVRTVFNILSPLTNPAHANMQVMGVYDINLVEPLSHVLSNLGVKRGMVVYGLDRLDEISPCAPTYVCDFSGSNFHTYTIKPEDFGLVQSSHTALVSTPPAQSASITREIFNGVTGPRRDIVLLNAGAGLYVSGKAQTLSDGIALAAEIIDSGRANAKLDEFISNSHLV